jgi:hypothetical protein
VAKPEEDPEIRRLLKQYVGAKVSDPPSLSRDTAEAESRLMQALVSKIDSFERTRKDLARQLGTSIRDSGTFEPLGQDYLDVTMLRVENARLQKENGELKDIIKVWTNRKDDWTIRILVTSFFALVGAVWGFIALTKK